VLQRLVEERRLKELRHSARLGSGKNTKAPIINRGLWSILDAVLHLKDSALDSLVKRILIRRVTAEGEGVEP